MAGDHASIIHVNVTNFAASVATSQDPSLADKAFAIAREGSARQIIMAPSRRAMEEGIHAGMPVATALRMVPTLTLISPDASACAKAESAMFEIASRYSPTIQHDSGGHMYLDVAGTTRLFGPPVDCAVRIRNEIHNRLGIEPAVAVASNKLVAKIGTRAIRPSGITQVREGDEELFLARQDMALLPGVGPTIGRLLAVAGFSDIGQLAALDDMQVEALLGRRGLALRNAARGWDISVVDPRHLGARTIHKRVDFSEPVGEIEALRAAMVAAAEDAGLDMRKELLACTAVNITLFWADGATSEGKHLSSHPLVLDSEVLEASWKAMQQAMRRRVRIRAFILSLQRLLPAKREPDLFTPPGPTREERLQSAVDATRLRFGPATLTHAAAVFRV